MPYTPRSLPAIQTVEELRKFMEEEFQIIALHANETTEVYFRPVNRQPDKIRDGLVAFADGTNWNPGTGQGLYEYRGGAWHKLS